MVTSSTLPTVDIERCNVKKERVVFLAWDNVLDPLSPEIKLGSQAIVVNGFRRLTYRPLCLPKMNGFLSFWPMLISHRPGLIIWKRRS